MPLWVPSDKDRRLLARAEHFHELRGLDELEAETLSAVSAEHGIDFATALLFNRIRESARHGEFIRAIDGMSDGEGTLDPGERRLVVVAPGAFHKTRPHVGADGRRLREAAERAGYETAVIPLGDFAPVEENARAISDWLFTRRDDGRRVILVSLSKSSAEVRLALATPDGRRAFRDVDAWVDLSGIATGSRMMNRLLTGPVRSALTHFLCRWCRIDVSVVKQLAHTPGGPLEGWPEIPPHLRVVHVVGFPLARHLTSRVARRNYRCLAPLGPNDGGGILLAEAVATMPGVIYPVWGADPFMRPAGCDKGRLVARVLGWVDSRPRGLRAGAPAPLAPAVPAGRESA